MSKSFILEHITCDFCGEKKYKELYRKPDTRFWVSQYPFPVVQCLNCDLVYLNPRPTQESMAMFYPETYHQNRDGEKFLKRYKKQKIFLPEIKNKSVLDIGCAKGDFLEFLKTNEPTANFTGVDFFSDGIKHPGIRFIKTLLPCPELKNEEFDVITAWAVMEHLHTPSDYFKDISRILKTGGSFVFQVPNSESLWGRHAYREDTPRHTYHFSPASLEKYAKKNGFKVSNVIFDDELFDGRGKGTFKHLFGKLSFVKWENHYLKQFNLLQKFSMWIGKTIDNFVFSYHWEVAIKRSGNIVVIFQKV